MSGEHWHGTPNGYSNYRCRCDECRAAWASYFRDGPGAAAMRRYRQKLKDAGLVISGGLSGKARVRKYAPRPNARGKRS
jgi:hypothetical protein